MRPASRSWSSRSWTALPGLNQFWLWSPIICDQVKAEGGLYPMAPKTGTSSRFTSLTCSKPFQQHPKLTSSTIWCHHLLNNWQSIDFRETWMPFSLKKCFGPADSNYELPTVIWQDNTRRADLDFLGWFWQSNKSADLLAGRRWKSHPKPLRDKRLRAMAETSDPANSGLWDRAQQVTIDLPIEETITACKTRLHLDFTPFPIRPSLSPALRAWKQENTLNPILQFYRSIRMAGRCCMLSNLTGSCHLRADAGHFRLSQPPKSITWSLRGWGRDARRVDGIDFLISNQPSTESSKKERPLRLVLYTTDACKSLCVIKPRSQLPWLSIIKPPSSCLKWQRGPQSVVSSSLSSFDSLATCILSNKSISWKNIRKGSAWRLKKLLSESTEIFRSQP